jgi:DNA helicase HerA-like ATPase
VGEALVSFLDDKGRPDVVERAFIIAPNSRLGPLSDDERQAAIRGSVLYGHYEQVLDRESAYERLRAQAEAAAARTAERPRTKEAPTRNSGTAAPPPSGGGLSDVLFGSTGPRGGKRDGLVQIAAKTVTRTIGSTLGRQIVRGLLGSLLGGKR